MQHKRERIQQQMTLLPPLESFIPADHYLRKLNRVLDLGFIHEAVRDCYCQDNGRPSIDPEVVIRLFLIQAIEGIPQVRELMRQVQMHLGYRWFIGYELDEKLPDHSTLSKALDRFGDKVFDELFERSVAQCQQSGLIEGRVFHVDATTIRADIDSVRVGLPGNSDRDARFGRFPNGTKQPGYKQQTVVDDDSRVVLEVSVEPANTNEGGSLTPAVQKAAARLDSLPETVCADSAYANGKNASDCYCQGIRLVSPPRKARNHHSHEQFTIEQFDYNEEREQFICPAGKVLRKAGRISEKKGRWKYRASAKDCRRCQLKSQCTQAPQRCLNVTVNHGALIRLRQDSQSASFKALYRRRAPVIEGIFAEGKQWHSLGRAWRRGLSKMRVQCLLVSTVLNLKRLVGVLDGSFGIRALFASTVGEIAAILRTSKDDYSILTSNLLTIRATI